MHAAEVRQAVAAVQSLAADLGLAGDEAIVLQNSNKLTVRLLPADVVARVAPSGGAQVARFEVELARRLAEVGGPVAALDPRVNPIAYERGGFWISFWTYYQPVPSRPVAPAAYATALRSLHAGLRVIELAAPRFTDRADDAQRLVADRDRSPGLADADRELLLDTLRSLSRAVSDRGSGEQLLHGDPHPWNLLNPTSGLRFIDLETCSRGPIEFDLAHAPVEVARHYPGVDPDLLDQCRILVLAMITSWRCDRDDQLPNGLALRREWLGQLRAARAR